MPGSRRPSIVLPVPGGPASRTLWSPAAASSSARRAALLPSNLRQIGDERLLEVVAPRRAREPDLLLSPEVGDRLGEMGDGDDVDARERRLRSGFRRADEPLQARAMHSLGNRDRAGNRSYAPIQRKLADAGVLEQSRRSELMRAGQHGQRDREIEPRALLAERRRGEVDGDPVPRRPREHRR